MITKKTLIFVPTYNKCGNAPKLCSEIHKLGLNADVLFVDDNSPDGTGEVLEELKSRFPRLIVHHRVGKLGIGSAHSEAIQWAYEQRYEILITMDCDFTHSPADIPKMVLALSGYCVAVGSRFMSEGSLMGWTFFRIILTRGGHFLTKALLGIPFDASGAFRVYDLSRIPRDIFMLVKPKGYAFFFESLFILSKNNISINEISIVLPSRESGATV